MAAADVCHLRTCTQGCHTAADTQPSEFEPWCLSDMADSTLISCAPAWPCWRRVAVATAAGAFVALIKLLTMCLWRSCADMCCYTADGLAKRNPSPWAQNAAAAAVGHQCGASAEHRAGLWETPLARWRLWRGSQAIICHTPRSAVECRSNYGTRFVT